MARADDIIEVEIPADAPEDILEVETGESLDVDRDDFESSWDRGAANIVEEWQGTQLGDEALKEVSEEVRANFDAMWESNAPRREQEAKDWRIFAGELPKKTFPFDQCANIHIPMMFENITRLQMRAMGELFGDWTNVFGVQPVGPDDDDIAELLSHHGNWQLREKIPTFKGEMSRAMLMFFGPGDITCASSYDMVKRQNVHEILTRDEFVTPYAYTSVAPDYSDVPHNARILRWHRHELERYRDIWSNVDKALDREKPSWESADQPIREAVERYEGVIQPSDDSAAPYQLIQYEGWMTLPGEDNQRYVKCVIDYDFHHVLSLTIHEEQDWEDVERYERQEQELTVYQQQRQAYSEYAQIEEQAKANLQGNQELGPAEQMGMNDVFNAPQQPPKAPEWMADGSDEGEKPRPIRMVPIRLIAHGLCIEPVAGNLGMGFGPMQANFNRAVNTMVDQHTDASTLQNGAGWIVSESIQFESPLKLGPGSINKVTGVTGGELQNNIIPMKPGPASPGLMTGVQLLLDQAQSSMQAPDVLSGEPGKSGETAQGISLRSEQASKQLSVATRKFASPFLERILRHNGKLNSIFLSEQEFFMVNNHVLNPETRVMESKWEQMSVGRNMYRRDYRVEVKADLKYGSDMARVADADSLVQASMTIPALQQNMSFQYEAMKRSLEARDLHDMVPFLGPKPPPQATPMALPMPPPAEGGAPPPEGQPV